MQALRDTNPNTLKYVIIEEIRIVFEGAAAPSRLGKQVRKLES